MRKSAILMIALLLAGMLALPLTVAYSVANFDTKVPVGARLNSETNARIHGMAVNTRGSVNIDVATEESGVEITEQDLKDFRMNIPDNRFILVSIYGYGEDVRFSIVERRYANTPEDVNLDVNSDYRGKIHTSDEIFAVSGSSLDNLDVRALGKSKTLAEAENSAEIVGKASLDEDSLLIKFDSGRELEYKIESIERKPLKPVMDPEEREQRMEKRKSILDVIFGREDTAASDSAPGVRADVQEDAEISKERVSLFARLRAFFGGNSA